MRAVASWRRLSPARRSLLPRVFVTTAAVRLGLATLPFGALSKILEYARRRTPRGPARYSEDDVTWCVSRASKAIPGATCLTRALATQLLLARCGLRSAVLIGVRRPERGRLEAHAWVVVDGRVVTGGRGADGYTPLRSAPTGSRPRPT